MDWDKMWVAAMEKKRKESSNDKRKEEKESKEEYKSEKDEEESMYARYIKQVNDSDVLGKARPVDFNNPIDLGYAQKHAKTAVEAFNRTPYQNEEGRLEFVKVEMAMVSLAVGHVYHITFTAKNLKHGKNIIYQSLVWEKISAPVEVTSFRRKPSVQSELMTRRNGSGGSTLDML